LFLGLVLYLFARRCRDGRYEEVRVIIHGTTYTARKSYEAFAKGRMRKAYWLELDLGNDEEVKKKLLDQGWKFEEIHQGRRWMVIKRYITRVDAQNTQALERDQQTQAQCRKMAREFNEAIIKESVCRNGSDWKPAMIKTVDFVPTCLVHIGQDMYLMEPWLTGEFIKWSNNWDYINERNHTPHTFTHYTYHYKLPVVDLQGVETKSQFLFTDPQIHSYGFMSTLQRWFGNTYGKGDMGYDGVVKWKEKHRCNGLCQALNLPLVNSAQVHYESYANAATCIRRG